MNNTGIPHPEYMSTLPPTTASIRTIPNFKNGFISSLSVVLASELGDKTFFITAILAMRHSKKSVFLGAVAAATVMILLSVALGWVTSLIPQTVTHYVAILLFAVFGIQMLVEGFNMSSEVELTSVMETVNNHDASKEVGSFIATVKKILTLYLSAVFIETFTMNCMAEWGDRSQISTVLLAANEDVLGVTFGAISGQIICNALAVISGRFISKIISVKTVTLTGGCVFLSFALYPLILGSNG